MKFLLLLLNMLIHFCFILWIPALIFLICAFDFICKNRKNFKYIFKTSELTRKSDIIQISAIIVLLVFIAFFSVPLFVYIYASQHSSCSPCGYIECRSGLKKMLSATNQAVSLEKALKNKIPYNNINDFGLMLGRRFSVSEIYNVKTSDLEIVEYIKTLKKKDIKKYKLEEYEGKPVINIQDGTSIMISKFENDCKNIDMDNPENCDCLIDVDLNGFKNEPNNKKDFNLKRIKNDRYTFVIDGNEDKILPLSIYLDYIFPNWSD